MSMAKAKAKSGRTRKTNCLMVFKITRGTAKAKA
jgi:hypothetical protein